MPSQNAGCAGGVCETGVALQPFVSDAATGLMSSRHVQRVTTGHNYMCTKNSLELYVKGLNFVRHFRIRLMCVSPIISRVFACCRVGRHEQNTENHRRDVEAAGVAFDKYRIVEESISRSVKACSPPASSSYLTD
jgi:hypothetical protein